MYKYSEIEKKWQRRWEEEKIFYADAEIETESEIDQDQKKKFFLTVPYPYASGPLHIGHGRTYTIADIIARFKRLQGYNVLFPMGFHVTGTPILAIADRIAKGEEEVIERYKEYVAIYADADPDADPDPERVEAIVKTFDKPEIVADFFAEQIAADFKMMGYSIDWRRKFNTTEPFYKKFIEWQFKKLYEIGAIKRGKYPITFSIEDGCAVGEDDIEEGDIDKVSVVEYTAIKFKLSDQDQDQDQDTSNTYLIAATLRPETIFGVTNLWVNPDGRYVNVKVGDEFWIMSKEALEKLSYQREDVKILEGEGREIDGNALLWKQVKEPVADREIPILPASFVDTDVGTGLVYSVPAHAPYDYIGLEDLRKRERVGVGVVPVPVPEPIKIIEIEGYEQYEFPAREICKKMGIKDANDARLEEATQILYKDEFYRGVLNEKCKDFKGLKIAAIKDEVKTWLNMTEIFYETSRKAVTRAGGKVIVAVLQDQWFIDYRDMRWKDSGHKLVGDMTFYPEKYKAYMHEIIDWLTLRPCARRRGLGTQFPFEKGWIIESLSDSTIYMAMYTIAHQLRDVPVDALEEAFFDYIFLGLGPGLNNANAENVAKELPVQISVDILNRLRKEFEYWYPNDLRHTAPPHLSNHLVFFLMHHAAIFPARHWPIAITLSELMIREGQKISKSKGNVIPLAHVSKLYGVDLYRLYCALNADFDTLSNWREQDIDALRRRFNALITIFDESIETGTGAGAGAGAGVEADVDALEEYEFTHTDRWLLSKFYRRLQESIEWFDGFRIREAGINMVFNLMNDLKYYEKRESVERRRRIVRNILEDWLIILSPIVPHICEELWHKLKLRDRDKDRDMDQEKEKETFISRQALPGIKLKFIDEKVEREEEYLVSLVRDVQEILRITRITPNKIYIYTADAETERWKCELFKAMREIADKDKIKEAMKIQKDKSKRTETVSFVKQLINSKGKSRSKLEYFELNETEILRREKAYLAKEFGCEIGINEEHDPKGKKKFAIPLKPAIYVG